MHYVCIAHHMKTFGYITPGGPEVALNSPGNPVKIRSVIFIFPFLWVREQITYDG